MTSLLVGTFVVSGAHTAAVAAALAAIPREADKEHALEGQVYVRRFRHVRAQPAPDGDHQLPGPGLHGHDPEVLLRAVGQRGRAPVGRLRGGRAGSIACAPCSLSPTSARTCGTCGRKRQQSGMTVVPVHHRPGEHAAQPARLAGVHRAPSNGSWAKARGRNTAAGPIGKNSITSPCSGAWP